jgi:hypothetical protein
MDGDNCADAAMVLIVSEEVPEPPATEVGLKTQDAPVGNPEQDKLTAELKPVKGVTVTVNGVVVCP